MLFFKPYASRCVTLHPATGKGCRQQMSISTTEKGQEEGGRKKKKKEELQRSLCYRKRMELFSYRTRSGWLPRLSPPPCSWRCKCNLLHPLSWRLLLPILNHPRSGCTYHPFQGQRCYCSRGKKRRKRHVGAFTSQVFAYTTWGAYK